MSRFQSLIIASIVVAAALGPTRSRAAVPLDLSAYRGHVVYLDFWASWCGPCKQSFPWMRSMQKTYARRGLVVVAVDLDAQPRDAARFLAQFRPNFRIVYDPSGSLARRFEVAGMPTSLVIGPHGRVRGRHIGFIPADATQYERQVEQLLAAK